MVQSDLTGLWRWMDVTLVTLTTRMVIMHGSGGIAEAVVRAKAVNPEKAGRLSASPGDTLTPVLPREGRETMVIRSSETKMLGTTILYVEWIIAPLNPKSGGVSYFTTPGGMALYRRIK